MSKEYIYYGTLSELKEEIEDAIMKYGGNTRYIIVGCYGAEGDVVEIKASTSEPIVHIITDLCSG